MELAVVSAFIDAPFVVLSVGVLLLLGSLQRCM